MVITTTAGGLSLRKKKKKKEVNGTSPATKGFPPVPLVDNPITKLEKNKNKSIAPESGIVKQDQPPKEGIIGDIVTKDGRTYLGPGEAENLAQIQLKGKIQSIEGELMERRLSNIAGQVGNLEAPQTQTPTELDRRQALIAGAQNVIPQAVGFGVAGAGAGLVGTGGALSAPLAVVGAIGGSVKGFYEGYNKNLKSQASGIIKGRTYSLLDAEKGMRDLINMQNSKIGSPEKNQELFNDQLAQIRDAHRQLKLDTDENLNRWLDDVDGTKQLYKFQVFYDTGRDYEFIQMMNEATINPNPAAIVISTDAGG